MSGVALTGMSRRKIKHTEIFVIFTIQNAIDDSQDGQSDRELQHQRVKII